MNKTQKKCFLASTGMHLLLFLVLLVGPAFLMRTEKVEDMPVLEFIPDILVDAPVQSGGVQPPPPQLNRQPDPQPDRQVKTPPVTPTPTPAKTEPSKPDVKTPNKIDLSNVKRTTKSDPKPDTRSRHSTPAPDFDRAARDIRSAISTTSIAPSAGTDSGQPSAEYAQAIKSIYEMNWSPPDQVSSADALVKVEIVIAKNGTVVSSRIIKPSGDASVDGSVRDTLDRVRARGVPAFPVGSKDNQRSYIIGFNLKSKRAFG